LWNCHSFPQKGDLRGFRVWGLWLVGCDEFEGLKGLYDLMRCVYFGFLVVGSGWFWWAWFMVGLMGWCCDEV